MHVIINIASETKLLPLYAFFLNLKRSVLVTV